MIRIFMITQPNVISFITLRADGEPLFPEATIFNRVARLVRTGPGWALYQPKEQTQEAV